MIKFKSVSYVVWFCVLCIITTACSINNNEYKSLSKINTIYKESTLPYIYDENLLSQSDLFSDFIAKEIMYIDDNLNENILGTPQYYMTLCDFNNDGQCEFFFGALVNGGIDYCCYNYQSNFEPKFVFSSDLNRAFLDSKKYIDDKGNAYFRSVRYIGNPTNPGAIIYKIQQEDEKWVVTSYETYIESEFESNDSYEKILVSTINIDRNNINKSVEDCIYNYYNQ